MKNNKISCELNRIAISMYDVLALINLVKDSCDMNDYNYQSTGLEIAMQKQQQLIQDVKVIVC